MPRPSKYETKVKPYFDEIRKMLERGLTEKEVAKSLGIAYSTYNEYKLKYSEFAEAIKSVDLKPLIKDLENALIKRAKGYDYEEKKQYITEDADGNKKKHTEITTKHQPPDTTAIFGALNRFDPNYVKDQAYYDLKKQELELRKAIAKENAFDDFDF